MAYDPEMDWTEETEGEWRTYLRHFKDNIYPMFQQFNVSFDAALTVWFVNRLRNAIPDDNAGNNPWEK